MTYYVFGGTLNLTLSPLVGLSVRLCVTELFNVVL